MNWFLAALKKYAIFSGRARRKEYWFWILFVYLIGTVMLVLDPPMGTITLKPNDFGLFSGIFMLIIIIPTIAVAIRRLHDSDRSGWWLILAFVPLIGGIWLLVLMVLDGTAGANQYGEDPQGR